MANVNEIKAISKEELSFEDFKKAVLSDYKIAVESREASLLGRKEVLTGKAKFGIFGDGKEVAQLAKAKHFQAGDFRSGYYRDQTFMFAIGELSLSQWFAQLYAHNDVTVEPHSAGRQMSNHFATRSLNPDGSWKDLTKIKNTSADISPTGGQMPRLLGLAMASKYYRENTQLQEAPFTKFSNKGNEIAIGTIGDASTSEGLFWETVNAAGVTQVPMLLSVWDDGHGISVPKKYQTTKESISEILKGFQRDEHTKGFEIFKTKGWDYAHMCETYEKAAAICRQEHVPVVVHVEEMTQPQGHSTSGSHERYKSKERLQWEEDFDCIKKMREWIINTGIAKAEELDEIGKTAAKTVRDAKAAAWTAFMAPTLTNIKDVVVLLDELASQSEREAAAINQLRNELSSTIDPLSRDVVACVRRALRLVRGEQLTAKQPLLNWYNNSKIESYDRFNTNLYSQSQQAVLKQRTVDVSYDDEEKKCDAREILRDNFDAILAKYPEVLIFGEDAGKIGGVNQGLEGLQKKYGEVRVFDTGIREATIVGQALGMAMRGLRPIAEIQYLDYLLYAIQVISDDLATLQYRTKGGQKAPVVMRTRGHRLEGVWHSGSPLGMIINAARGIHVCVPRNMTQAAGFYNTLLAADEPALVIEPLNGYRLKERLPTNFGEFKVALGQPEIIREGTDLTIVTYGSCCRIATDAAARLEQAGISVEVVDVQTLLPFDTDHQVVNSIKKTNRVLFFDEDVPGGASAYMMQQVLEVQEAYKYLDAAPKTLTGKDHRPAYGSDADYFCKPSIDDVFDTVYSMMQDFDPNSFPEIYN